jgi:hypothetical protein
MRWWAFRIKHAILIFDTSKMGFLFFYHSAITMELYIAVNHYIFVPFKTGTDLNSTLINFLNGQLDGATVKFKV